MSTTPSVPTFTRDTIPDATANWGEFVKQGTTKLLRMNGSFAVETQEGAMTCEDGFLAVDPEGYPYPIKASVVEASYTAAPEPPTIVERIIQLTDELERHAARLFSSGQQDAGAVAVLARRHLEDARSRYTESRARELGVFQPADIDKRTAAQERQAFHQAIDAAGPSAG